jgi:hypothetical protein
MRHLIKVTETYRIANENEVKTFIEELKSDPNFEIAKYSSQKKEKKKGGEVVDEWIRFEVVKLFDDEKEPLNNVEVNYERA